VPLQRLSSLAEVLVGDSGFAAFVVVGDGGGGEGRTVVVVVRTVTGLVVVVGANVVVEATGLPVFKITNSGGAWASPKSDLVTQHCMLILQRPSTLRTASQ